MNRIKCACMRCKAMYEVALQSRKLKPGRKGPDRSYNLCANCIEEAKKKWQTNIQ